MSGNATTNRERLPRNLKAARAAAGLTQEEAGRRVGLSKQAISDQERGVYAPTEENLDMLAVAYGTTKAALRYGSALRVAEDTGRWPANLPAGDARKAKLPPRAYARAYEYLERLKKAGIPEDMIDESERLMTESVYSKLNKRDVRVRTEDDLITDINAAWDWIAEVIERQWGIKP